MRAGEAVGGTGLTLCLAGVGVGVFGGCTFGPCPDTPAVVAMLLVAGGALTALAGGLLILGRPPAGRDGEAPKPRDDR